MDFRGIVISDDELGSLARRWGIASLAVFGSALREDFSEASDVDLLISFKRDAAISALDLVRIRDDLASLFGRPVDLIEPESIVNPFRRQAILSHTHTIYAA